MVIYAKWPLFSNEAKWPLFSSGPFSQMRKHVTIYAKRDHMPYFVQNELYTVPDSPVDANFNEVFCTGIKFTGAKL